MPLSKRELMLLERAERAGTKVNWSALDREFNFTLSGIVTTGVDFSLFVQLCESVSSIAESQNFVCELEEIGRAHV